jgi:hypothetical protein
MVIASPLDRGRIRRDIPKVIENVLCQNVIGEKSRFLENFVISLYRF